mmetsp:Transcript_5390/g.4574  ORF Transcript_5390/g.4574 Transcript_5390/m.4574 type:complete len:115 (-) Transcript_5390:669-1013(-)
MHAKELTNPETMVENFFGTEKRFVGYRKAFDYPSCKNLSFPEVLIFASNYEKRVLSAFKNIIRIDDLYYLITSAKQLPVSVSGMIQLLNEKYYTATILDLLLEPCIEFFKNLSE